MTNAVYNQYICTWDNGRTVTYGTNDDQKVRQQVLSYSNWLSEFDHESSAPNYKFFYSETLQSFLFECDRKWVEFKGRPTGFSYIYQYDFNETRNLYQELCNALAPASFPESYPPEDFPEKKIAFIQIQHFPNELIHSPACREAVAYFIYQLLFGFPNGNILHVVCDCDPDDEWEFLFRRTIVQLLALTPFSLYKNLTFSISDSIIPKKGNIVIIPKSKIIQNNSTSFIYVTSSVELQNSISFSLRNKDKLSSLYWAKCFSLAEILMNPNNKPKWNYNRYRQVISYFHNTLITEQDRDQAIYKDLITNPSVYDSLDASEMCALLCQFSVYRTSWFEARKYSDAIVHFLNIMGSKLEDNVVSSIVNVADRMESSAEIAQILIEIFKSSNSTEKWFHPLFRKLFEKNEKAAVRINIQADKPIISDIKDNNFRIPIANFQDEYDKYSFWYQDKKRPNIVQKSIIEAYDQGIASQNDIESFDNALQICKKDHNSCYHAVMQHIAKTLKKHFETYYQQDKLDLFCQLLSKDSFRCDILPDKVLWKSLASVCEKHPTISTNNKTAVSKFGTTLKVPQNKIDKLLSKKTETVNTPQKEITVSPPKEQSFHKKQRRFSHQIFSILKKVLSSLAYSLAYLILFILVIMVLWLYIKT